MALAPKPSRETVARKPSREDAGLGVWQRCLASALEEQLVEIKVLLQQQREGMVDDVRSCLRANQEGSPSNPMPSPAFVPKPVAVLPLISPLQTPRVTLICDDTQAATCKVGDGEQTFSEDTTGNDRADAVELNEMFAVDDVCVVDRTSPEGDMDRTASKQSASSSSVQAVVSLLKRGHSQLISNIKGKQYDEDPWWVFPLDTFICLTILANAGVTFAQAQYKGWQTAKKLGLEEDDGRWSHAEITFAVLEHVFNAAYIMELILRLGHFRCAYFSEKANVFDFVIVLVTTIDAYIIVPIFRTKAAQNLSIARLVRVFRLARVVRIFKMLRFAKNLTELRVLFLTVSSSARALLWSMLLMAVILFAAGIAINQLVYNQSLDALDLEMRLWIYQYFGNGARATYTMFEATFSGCWPTYARPLIEEVNGYLCIFFIAYNVTITFATLRIIGAIFLNETIKAANRDTEQIVMSKMKEKEAFQGHLREFFFEADTSGDGYLSIEELGNILNDEHVKTWLSVLELEFHELEYLFKLLDDNDDGEVSLEEFLRGVMRLKGEARALDSIYMMHEVGKIKCQLTDMMTALQIPAEGEGSHAKTALHIPA